MRLLSKCNYEYNESGKQERDCANSFNAGMVSKENLMSEIHMARMLHSSSSRKISTLRAVSDEITELDVEISGRT
jgi:hypothetical protein